MAEKRYTILIKRIKEYKGVLWNRGRYAGTKEDSTVGELQVFETATNKVLFKCFTIENGGPSTDESGKDKRIVARTYNLKWRKPTSVTLPAGWDKAPWLYTYENTDFESRFILIHVGNSPHDSRGCILLNTVDKKDGTGAGSGEACKKFFSLLEEKGIENFSLEIDEILKNS